MNKETRDLDIISEDLSQLCADLYVLQDALRYKNIQHYPHDNDGESAETQMCERLALEVGKASVRIRKIAKGGLEDE